MPELYRSARFSRCKQYRYELNRKWGEGDSVVFIGLNPSTADHRVDDPTVRRCISFAEDWGFEQLSIVNLFGYRSPDPSVLPSVKDPVGASNDRIVRQVVSNADLVVVAWGVHGQLHDRGKKVLSWVSQPHCLGFTKDGAPRHPLYMPRTSKPLAFDRS